MRTITNYGDISNYISFKKEKVYEDKIHICQIVFKGRFTRHLY